VIEPLVNIAVAVEAIAGVVLVAQSFREYRFLIGLKPYLPSDESLPLYQALVGRAVQITAIGIYLIILTAIGAVLAAVDLPPLAQSFPLLRAINGFLFLVLLSGALQVGKALRSLRTD